MNIGQRIKARREELGMTQDELARAVGYKWRSSINKIETDGARLPQRKIVEIAKALKVTPSYLMGWEDEDIAIITAEQEMLIEKFFQLTDEQQKTLLVFIDSLLNQKG